jgi:replicative DNA helicase
MSDQAIQASQAEFAIVAASMVDPSILDAIEIHGGMFLDSDLGSLLDAIVLMRASGRPLDARSIHQAASNAKSTSNPSQSLLEALGGTAAIARMIQNGLPAHWKYHADEVHRWHSVRNAKRDLQFALKRLNEAEPNVSEIVSQLDAKLSSVSPSKAGQDFSFGEMAELSFTESLDVGKQLAVIDWPWFRMNNNTGGLFPGEFTLLGARPGIGKSAFGLGVAVHAAKQGKRVGFVSCEMSHQQLGHRLLAMETSVPMTDMRTGTLNDHQKQKIEKALPLVKHLTGRAWIASRPTINQIRSRAKLAKATGGLDLLVVDYLGLMGADNPKASIYERVTEISNGLKALAIELNIPLLVLAQLNRDAGKTDDHPRLEHLRDSGSLEQDADNVIFIHRQRDCETGEFVVAKQRQGSVGLIPIRFDRQRCAFESVDDFSKDFNV